MMKVCVCERERARVLYRIKRALVSSRAFEEALVLEEGEVKYKKRTQRIPTKKYRIGLAFSVLDVNSYQSKEKDRFYYRFFGSVDLFYPVVGS